MGNLLTCRAMDVAGASGGKVLIPDGSVYELDQPTSVAELMLEHPRLFVVDAQSLSEASSGASKATPLPADHTLDPKKVYVMLPMTRGKAASAIVEEARRALEATAGVMSNSRRASWAKVGSRRKGLVAAAAAGRNDISTPMVMEKGGKATFQCSPMANGRWEWTLQSASSADVTGQLSRQYSGSRGWKPSLHTIEERCLRAQKVSHWLF